MRNFSTLARRFIRRPLPLFGLIVVVVMVLLAVFADRIATHDPLKPHFTAILQGPGGEFIFGTDELGRDLWSRIVFGTRASLQAGLIAVGLAVAIGLPIGLLSGYYGGVLDTYIIMPLTDAVMSIPVIVLAIALAVALSPGLTTAMIAIGIVYAPVFIRITRGEVLTARGIEYVEAARALGASNGTIMFRHILPNIMAPITVQATLSVASAILVEASLSFLGLGVQPPMPSWGSMLRLSIGYLDQAPWLSLGPGLAIFVTVLGINLFGDGLRDVLDPREEY